MKALILNSGMGSRMGVLTSEHPKCMTEIYNTETILSRQLRQLADAGIMEAVITTGRFDSVLVNYCASLNLPLHITYVKNPLYDRTNYIYSIFCARECLDDDIILMHGDIVFENEVLDMILSCGESCMAVSSALELPEKDFKAVIQNGYIDKIGIEFFNNAVAAQPLYKLKRDDFALWLAQIETYIKNNEMNCYAENAFNDISDRLHLYPLDIKDMLCAEVDDADDYAAVSSRVKELELQGQKIFSLNDDREDIKAYIKASCIHRMFLVCGSSVSSLNLYDSICRILKELQIEIVHFADFCPNPQYSSIVNGVQMFRERGCDGILAIGGGSAIDVAKCTKLFAHMDTGTDFLKQACLPNRIPLIAVPTTAGSGSEATRFAAVYRNGRKLSISHEELIPSMVIQYSNVLNELPLYQKKATALDALCHCMESFWSINSTAESRKYAAEGICTILENVDRYLAGDGGRDQAMMEASYAAGRAINISQTTAGHAMSYKLTDMFGLAHGHAAALCVDRILPHLLRHTDDADMCLEPRGIQHLRNAMLELSRVMGGKCMEDSAAIFHGLLVRLDMDRKLECSEEELEILSSSVNTERLRNHPIKLDGETIRQLYRQIIKFIEKEA